MPEPPQADEPPDDEAIHGWFGLSYASWLCLPRAVLQSMPPAWQRQFVGLLRELDATFDWVPEDGTLTVQLKDRDGKFLPMPPELGDYRRGRVRWRPRVDTQPPEVV